MSRADGGQTKFRSRTDEDHPIQESATQASWKGVIADHRHQIAAVMFTLTGLILALAAKEDGLSFGLIWFFGLPVVYALLRYMWLRLCRDPFLTPRYAPSILSKKILTS